LVDSKAVMPIRHIYKPLEDNIFPHPAKSSYQYFSNTKFIFW